MSSQNRSFARVALALCASVGVSAAVGEAFAASVIKRPGAHPKYSVELEPHGILGWGDQPFGEVGLGLGMHATIPIIEQGPIKKINNSMGLGFGLDWAHYGDNDGYCGWYGAGWWRNRGFAAAPTGYDCSGNQLWFPVVWQWNFWLTDIISVYGEPGIAIEYENVTVPCVQPNGVLGNCDYDDVYVRPVFWGGGRFMFGDSVGLNVKIGWPSIQIGASILL